MHIHYLYISISISIYIWIYIDIILIDNPTYPKIHCCRAARRLVGSGLRAFASGRFFFYTRRGAGSPGSILAMNGGVIYISIWETHIANWKDPPFLIGKSAISMVTVHS